jgi:hypothetical protein
MTVEKWPEAFEEAATPESLIYPTLIRRECASLAQIWL